MLPRPREVSAVVHEAGLGHGGEPDVRVVLEEGGDAQQRRDAAEGGDAQQRRDAPEGGHEASAA